MFYIAAIILSIGIQRISEFLEEFISYNSLGYSSFYYTYDLKLLWIGFFLVAIGLFFIVLKWNNNHKHYMFWRIIAYLLFFAGFGNLIDVDSDYLSYCAQIVFSLSYFIPGILIWIYNKKESKSNVINIENSEKTDLSQSNINSGSNIDRLRAKLKQASETNLAKTNTEFYNNLAHSSEILKEIQNDDFSIDQNFLEQIAKLTDFYLDLEDNKFQTNQSKKTLDEIVKTYNTINEALENIYDQNFSIKGLEIESDIISMKTKLNMDGALDSPFEKFKQE